MNLNDKNTTNTRLYFSENFIDLQVTLMKGQKILWKNKKVSQSDDEFLKKFSYGLPGNELFDQIDFDLNKTKRVYAERYGGAGVGDNGGGVRCVNDDIYQIKGGGKNILVGSGKDKWHSYGGLNAIDAVYETAISQVLKNILPVGVAEYYGIIHTGNKTAYNYEENIGHGALLIREVCLRPAHFLRSPMYRPNDELRYKINSDLYRIRRVIKELLQSFSNTNELINFIGDFILNSANQFAFSKVARICHGSVGPSNLSYDGRWLDLTNAGFLPTGMNYGGPLPVYNEAKSIFDIISDIIYTITKYGHLELNPAPLLHYYNEMFACYFSYHANYAYGLPYVAEDYPFQKHKNLYDMTRKIIESGKKVLYDWPDKLVENDQMLLLITGLYENYNFSNQTSNSLQKLCNLYGHDCNIIASEFNELSMESYKHNKITIPYKNFLASCFITSLNRIYISELFYKGRLERIIKYFIENDQLKKIRKLIEQANRISKWAFSKEWESNTLIFKSDLMSILYNGENGKYEIILKNDNSRKIFSSMLHVNKYISESNQDTCYNIINFDLKKYIKRHHNNSIFAKGVIEDE